MFKCDEQDQGFFLSEDMLSQENSSEYFFSVDAPDGCEIKFSANDKYLAVFSDRSLQVYEIEVRQAESILSINEGDTEEQIFTGRSGKEENRLIPKRDF